MKSLLSNLASKASVTSTTRGSVGSVVAMGMILATLGGDLHQLKSWADIDPAFVGGCFLHIGGVLLAIYSGKKLKQGEME